MKTDLKNSYPFQSGQSVRSVFKKKCGKETRTESRTNKQYIRSTKVMQAEKRQVRIADAILMEMDQEAETTKRLFNVIPDDKLEWRPHPKARTLGELAMHIAMVAGNVAQIAE